MENKNDSQIEADVLDLNRTAMSLLRDEQLNPALKCLQQALKILESVEAPDKKLKLQGITFNNFGCFYKRSKMPNVALNYLRKACVKEKDGLADSVNLAATHLNMCAIYSELGKHEVAIKESLQALQLMKNTMDYSPNFISTLVIAYYNTGVEYEFLQHFSKALEYYKLAWDTAVKYLGNVHSLSLSMQNNFNKAEKNLKGKEIDKSFKELIKHELIPKSSKPRISSAKKRPKSGKVEIRRNPSNSIKFKEKNESPQYIQNLQVSQLGLQNVRFLTGDRMQPMHKTRSRVQSAPRARTSTNKSSSRFKEAKIQVQAQNFPMKSPGKQLNSESNTQKFNSNYLKELQKRFEQRNKLEKAALVIQKCFRGYKSRKAVRVLKSKKELKEKTMKTIKELDDIKAQTEVFNSKFHQSIQKPKLETPKSANSPSKYNKSPGILSVQSLIRGKMCRNLLQKQIKSAILIQKTVRKYLTRKIYIKIKEAILFIQAVYKGYKVRKHLF